LRLLDTCSRDTDYVHSNAHEGTPVSDTLATLANLLILTFVLTSMAALGLSLTLAQISRPLSNLKLVGMGLVANFVVAPLVAWGVAAVLGFSDSLTLGLLLLGTAAGAPFLPKLAGMSKGDVAYSVGLMIVLMVVTIAYIPLVLVPLVEGIEVGAWDIARPLVFFMLIPLGIALGVRARYPESAGLAPHLNQISTVALALGAVLALGIALPDLVSAFGTGAFAGALLFVVLTTAGGYGLGGPSRGQRVVTGLGTGQRNISAALLIATTSFTGDAEVFVMVMVGAALMMVVLLPLAAELGRRAMLPDQQGS
jgi:predicted Na+-dependent transporter